MQAVPPASAPELDDDVLCSNLRAVADQMGLRDWTVEVSDDPPADHWALLTVDLPAERKVMRLRYSPQFWELDESEQRHALAHECGHALLRDLFETVRGGVDGELGGAALRVFLTQVVTEKERVVDVLASVIAPHLPELDWQTGPRTRRPG